MIGTFECRSPPPAFVTLTWLSSISDPEHYGSAERFLQLAIETLTDLGNHVVADEGLGEVNWYSDIPAILAEKGYIDAELRERWVRIK